MKKILITVGLILFVGICDFAVAGSYAKKVEITSSTPPIGAAFIKDAKVPDSSVVGVPAYPGAVILQTRKMGDMQTSDGRPYLPYVKLLSADPVDKVVAWYKEKLPSYFYQKSGFFGIYSHRLWKVKGDYGMMDMDAMGTIENVIVSDGGQHEDVYPEIQTMIEITYQPKTRK